MKFVEHTGANWAAVQLKAVEMEIEKQKRDWEEKRLAQKQQEELEKKQAEKEDNELLTYSRENAMNKVNIRSRTKSQLIGKRKSVSANLPVKANEKGKKTNGTEIMQNGKREKVESPTQTRRNSRIFTNLSSLDECNKKTTRTRRESNIINRVQRGSSKKSDKSFTTKSHIRSPSESTSRSAAESTSHQTTATSATPYDSDSECSLDVMIDSTDVNDSDSNSNQNGGNLHNDDSRSSETKSTKESLDDGKVEGTPRTRSRGTVKINLWTLDDSPILPPKRQKSVNSKSLCEGLTKEEKQLRADFGVKECKVSVVDVRLKPPESSMPKPLTKSRTHKRLLNTKNNHTLDSWIKKPGRNRSSTDTPVEIKEEQLETTRITRQRRHTILLHNTL